MRNQIEAPTIGTVPTVGAPAVIAPTVDAPVIVGDNTLPLGDTPLLGLYQFYTHEETVKRKREGENLLQQVVPGEGLEVVKDLMVDDDVEVNLEAISSKYGGGLLKGDKKDNDDKKDVEENVKSEEEQPQVAKEEDSKPPTVVVYYNGKKDVQHANETMVVAEASVDQKTVVSVEEQTLEVEKTEDKASQLVLMESEVDVTLKKMHVLTEDEINERAFIMACRINQLHAHLDELLLGVLLESFIQ
ncbi:hypothetical protein GIB67_004848 [Kingdonia uniflora]|uniref:Uncharacterized protein n=1 Tax=Kingdonia uniflora TaxID=39325 RepID=A0A7J7LNC6_9MAGN|nr:hypothetical protein GIB67_004848 [Kingdonia uniflora]